MKLLSQNKNTHLFCVFIVYSHFEMPVFGRHTKLDHGHLLSVWKAPRDPDTLEISQLFSFRTEKPENPIELG